MSAAPQSELMPSKVASLPHKLGATTPTWNEASINDAGQIVQLDSECVVVRDVSLDTTTLTHTSCESVILSVNKTVESDTANNNEQSVPYPVMNGGMWWSLTKSWYITPDYQADLVGRQLGKSESLVTRPMDWRLIAREDKAYTSTRPQDSNADTRLKLLDFDISYTSFVMGAVFSLYGVLTPCITIYNAMLTSMADTHVALNTLSVFQQFSIVYTILYPFASLCAVWVCTIYYSIIYTIITTCINTITY